MLLTVIGTVLLSDPVFDYEFGIILVFYIEIRKIIVYNNRNQQEGNHVRMIQKILAFLLAVASIFGGVFHSGQTVMKPFVFDITLDAATVEICTQIKEHCGLDIERIVTNLPDVNEPARFVNRVFSLDADAFRETMNEIGNEYFAQKNIAMGFICCFLGAYLKGFEKCDITLEPTGSFPGEYEFMLNVLYVNGETERVRTGVFYDPQTGEFHGRDDQGMASVGYNFNLQEMLVYAPINCWMRDFGFCSGYDLFCYTTPFFRYKTRRFMFDYQGKEWMIQIWKGRYIIADGAEVGLYNRPQEKAGTYYNCADDDELLNISFSLYHGDELLFSRAEQKHWWANGFKLMRHPCEAKDLTLTCTIEMKDEEMLQAFCDALERNPWHDVTYSTDGLKVSVKW